VTRRGVFHPKTELDFAMALGPGKYDDVCTLARAEAGMKPDDAGGVVVIVIGGKHGNGFSVQADFITTLKLPDLLEAVAKEIRRDGPV
jgi:hypothetical protein